MAKTIKFSESTIPNNYCQKVLESDLEWDPSHTQKIYEVIITAFSDFLFLAKSKNHPTAVAVKDLKGNFRFGAVVTYHPNENEDMPGNWSYEMSFKEEDIFTKETVVYVTTDTQFQQQLQNTGWKKYKIEWTMAGQMEFIVELFVSTLYQWLDTNASETEEVNIDLPGYFLASVAIENGEKVMSVVPDGAMKRLIKGDSALEEE